MTESRLGDSPTARQFGASVDIAGAANRSLYLVIGHRKSPRSAVTALGGEVVVALPDGVRVLAVMPTAAQLAIQRHPDVALAGPVSIDPDRFGRFVALAGLNGEASSNWQSPEGHSPDERPLSGRSGQSPPSVAAGNQ